MLNRSLKGLALFSTLFIMLTFLLPNIAYAATTVYVDPASQTDPSSPFTVSIKVMDVTDLYAWEFQLYYDKTILTISTVTLGPLLNTTAGGTANTFGILKDKTDNYNATHGRVWAAQTITGDRAGATVGGSGATLATLSFTVDGPGGTTPLAFNDTGLIGYNFATKTLSVIAHSTTDGSVTITAVPEFPLGLALETALIVAIIYVWRRKRRKEPKSLSVNVVLSPKK